MWVTKLLISPVKKRIFCPKTTKFGRKLAFLVNLGQAMQAHLVGGCGARAVSRKTPIYFITVKHPERLLIMIFSGSSEKLTSFLPHFSFIFLINHYFLRAVDNDNIWSGSTDKSYFVGVKSQRKCLRHMMWRPIKTLRHVMTNILRVF